MNKKRLLSHLSRRETNLLIGFFVFIIIILIGSIIAKNTFFKAGTVFDDNFALLHLAVNEKLYSSDGAVNITLTNNTSETKTISSPALEIQNSSDMAIAKVDNSEITLPSQFSGKQWNFISFPALGKVETEKLLLKSNYDPEARVFYWDPSRRSYEYYDGSGKLPYIESGKGYWISQDENNVIKDINYKSNSEQSYQIQTSKGWNSLGNPFTKNLDLKTQTVKINKDNEITLVQAADQGLIQETIYFYDSELQSYKTIDLSDSESSYLPKFSAFWVYVKSDQVTSLKFDRGYTIDNGEIVLEPGESWTWQWRQTVDDPEMNPIGLYKAKLLGGTEDWMSNEPDFYLTDSVEHLEDDNSGMFGDLLNTLVAEDLKQNIGELISDNPEKVSMDKNDKIIQFVTNCLIDRAHAEESFIFKNMVCGKIKELFSKELKFDDLSPVAKSAIEESLNVSLGKEACLKKLSGKISYTAKAYMVSTKSAGKVGVVFKVSAKGYIDKIFASSGGSPCKIFNKPPRIDVNTNMYYYTEVGLNKKVSNEKLLNSADYTKIIQNNSAEASCNSASKLVNLEFDIDERKCCSLPSSSPK